MVCFAPPAAGPKNDEVGQSVHPSVCLSVQHFASEQVTSTPAGQIAMKVVMVIPGSQARLLMILVTPQS